ncbi:hypothetical protein BOX15_Mlig015918g1 [Macrostomum lignano]|uniref:Kinesin-like protein n=1 Tax=Macrostomum lignano TaxID=282301 RepID=A0A267F3G2_9PLAT|nr:hypothetical protein BOX15_Mlig015918g1 [Macrostomum lignano]
MLEIYNENVRDLLGDATAKTGLPIRQHPNQGFYVHGLKKMPVGSYKEIEQRMEQGTSNRTVAATNMNATSSRAHTVVTIVFDQIIKSATGGETKKSSTMNLVDLAGSERADSTGATGDRLKEGANINKSLSALGNVISALADISGGKKKVMVPYRDSVLTKLLQNALGGNSKTVMIAALSPADINYDETLSTLRYADRAKKIKNQAVVNENPMDKLLRELQEENERLKKALDSGDLASAGFANEIQAQSSGMSKKDVESLRKEIEEQIRAQLSSNKEMMQHSDAGAWEAKLKAARADLSTHHTASDRKSQIPHLLNLNEDPMLSGVIVHYLEKDEVLIGRADHELNPEINLVGLSISKRHAVISRKSEREFSIRPGIQGARTKVNGLPLTGPLELTHKDRIVFGSNHIYVFMNPKNTECDQNLPKKIDWDFVQKEIANAKGFSTSNSEGLSKEQANAQEQILELIPMVTEVNAISEELNKHRSFEVILLPCTNPDGSKGSKCMVSMRNLMNDVVWMWERGKFMNRRYLMQDLYQRYLSGDQSVLSIPRDSDPFWEPPEELLIGSANVFLQSLAYCLDFEDRLPIVNYRGLEEGSVTVEVTPCTAQGRPLDEDSFVDEPTELLEKPFHFTVKIVKAELQRARYSKGCRVTFQLLGQQATTPVIKDTLEPQFKFEKLFSIRRVQQSNLDFFINGHVSMDVFCLQDETSLDPKLAKMTTRDLREMDRLATGRASSRGGGNPSNGRAQTARQTADSDLSRIRSELVALQRKAERLEAKERRLQALCREWADKPAAEQDFGALLRSVTALAHSSGSKFRTNAEIIAKMMRLKRQMQDDKTADENGRPNSASSKACSVM